MEVFVSFVHAYEDLNIVLSEGDRPALWHIKDNKNSFYSYYFPRNPSDFLDYQSQIIGELPVGRPENFKKLPRFGFTGLKRQGDHFYAGSWNGIYKIDINDPSKYQIISHRLMNDMHGIWATKEKLISVLTAKDTVVFTNYDGEIIDYFTIDNKLNVYKDESLLETDWRFVSKQFRGSTGYWHFNFVQEIDGQIWLTSRNSSCFVVVDLEDKTAHLRLMNHCTPVLIHDGILVDGKFYFTSVDGKIIIAQPHEQTDWVTQERVDNMHLYNRDLVCKVIRLEETAFGREPNWCRGIAVKGDDLFVTVDGRYDTELSFGLLHLKEDETILECPRLTWEEVGDEKEIRYVTGFDIEIISL